MWHKSLWNFVELPCKIVFLDHNQVSIVAEHIWNPHQRWSKENIFQRQESPYTSAIEWGVTCKVMVLSLTTYCIKHLNTSTLFVSNSPIPLTTILVAKRYRDSTRRSDLPHQLRLFRSQTQRPRQLLLPTAWITMGCHQMVSSGVTAWKGPIPGIKSGCHSCFILSDLPGLAKHNSSYGTSFCNARSNAYAAPQMNLWVGLGSGRLP